MIKTAKLISKYFGIIIIIFMILGFVTPGAFKWIVSKVFGLDEALMVGVVLVGTCPGETSSNVISWL